jgi:hypothetical protein
MGCDKPFLHFAIGDFAWIKMSQRSKFDDEQVIVYDQNAGWSSLVARWAHNPKVGGSNPPPATNAIIGLRAIGHLQQLSKTVQ